MYKYSLLIIFLLLHFLPVIAQDDKRSFTSPDGIFEILIPSKWVVENNSSAVLALSDPSFPSRKFEIDQFNYVSGEPPAITQFATDQMQLFKNGKNRNGDVLGSGSYMESNGIKWWIIDYVSKKGTHYKCYQAFLSKIKYTIYYICPSPGFSEKEAFADQIVKTFVFKSAINFGTVLKKSSDSVEVKESGTKGSIVKISDQKEQKYAQAVTTPNSFSYDSKHKPYRYAQLMIDKSGYGIQSVNAPAKPGIPVGIIDFEGRKIFDGIKTLASQKTQLGEHGVDGWVTYLSARPASGNSPVNMLAILDYTGQKYTPLMGKRVTDREEVNRIKIEVQHNSQVSKFLLENWGDDETGYSLEKNTPEVYRFIIPGIDMKLVCYPGVQGVVLNQLPYMLIVVMLNGKPYALTAGCSNFSDVYKLGENYFIRSDWEPCSGDENKSAINQITPTGLIEEVNF